MQNCYKLPTRILFKYTIVLSLFMTNHLYCIVERPLAVQFMLKGNGRGPNPVSPWIGISFIYIFSSVKRSFPLVRSDVKRERAQGLTFVRRSRFQQVYYYLPSENHDRKSTPNHLSASFLLLDSCKFILASVLPEADSEIEWLQKVMPAIIHHN